MPGMATLGGQPSLLGRKKGEKEEEKEEEAAEDFLLSREQGTPLSLPLSMLCS